MTEEIKAAYLGEALLLRWGESATQGRTVTLQLDEESQTHPFKGLKAGGNGQRMKLCAVLIDDHEQPQEPDRARRRPPRKAPVQPASPKVAKHFSELPRSQQAGIKCGDEDFDNWLRRLDGGYAGEDATTLLYYHLGITSRKQLDTDPEAAKRWDKFLTDFDYRDRVRA